MLACTETVTLVQTRYDPDTDLETYQCTPIYGVSWYGKLVVSMEDKGLKGATQFKVRIPEVSMPPNASIQNGDYVVRGVVTSIRKQADLEGCEYFKVMSVGDNRRGGLKHWAVSSV